MTVNEILDSLIYRLNNMFTVQTQEVIPELNKIKELLAQKQQEIPVVIDDVKQIDNEEVVEVKQEPSEEVKTEIKIERTIEELRKEYTDKFQKKPFGWRDRDVLIAKMK